MRTHHDIVHAGPAGPWAVAVTVALLGMALALADCAVGPKFVKHDAAINESWSEKSDSRLATQSGPDSARWRAFNDPTLDRLIQLAYHRGGGLDAVWRQFLMVAVIGLAFFTYSVSAFRKSIAVTK